MFSKGLGNERCQEILDAKYKIDIDLSSLERVKMTDWYAEGRIDGIKEGKAAGRLEKSAESVIGVMNKFGCSIDEALDAVNVAESDRDTVLELVEDLQVSSRQAFIWAIRPRKKVQLFSRSFMRSLSASA